MSPEQARCEPLDRRSDVYGLALVLVEATTRRRMFAADPQTAQAIAYECQRGPSREAAAATELHGRLPYSRTSFERVTHEVGELYEGNRSRSVRRPRAPTASACRSTG